MSGVAEAMVRKGYTPLAAARDIGIGWQGERLYDFWMWNGKYSEYEGGIKFIRTVKVNDLKEAALHFWRDGWVPLLPISDSLLRRMESALREHKGLSSQGLRVPDGEFLKKPEAIPKEEMGPDVRKLMSLPEIDTDGLRPKMELSEAMLKSYRNFKGV